MSLPLYIGMSIIALLVCVWIHRATLFFREWRTWNGGECRESGLAWRLVYDDSETMIFEDNRSHSITLRYYRPVDR